MHLHFGCFNLCFLITLTFYFCMLYFHISHFQTLGPFSHDDNHISRPPITAEIMYCIIPIFKLDDVKLAVFFKKNKRSQNYEDFNTYKRTLLIFFLNLRSISDVSLFNMGYLLYDIWLQCTCNL